MTGIEQVKSKFLQLMPNGTSDLFFIQIFSTLSYSVLYSTLVLYMTHKLGFSKSYSNNITGVFMAFNYALHLLGGYMGGRFMSYRSLFSCGMLCQVTGCLLISLGSESYLIWGLAAFLTGSGLNVTCVNCMLTQRFKPEDERRETAFLWNYSGMNIGFFTGFTVSGYFQLHADYQQLFIFASLGNFIAMMLAFFNWSQLADKDTYYSRLDSLKKRKNNRIGLIMMALLIPALAFTVNKAQFSGSLIAIAGVIMMGVLLVMALQQPDKAAMRKMFAFVGLTVASLVFWTLYQTAPMGLTLFIKHNVDSQFLGYIVPPQWVGNINTMVIVIGGPLLAALFDRLRRGGMNINLPMQFAFALSMIGLGFVILPIGISMANQSGLTHFNWIIASYVLQSIGELFISPIGYAMVGRLAPHNLQGVMMGSWMMIQGVAATASTYFSNQMVASEASSPFVSNPAFSHNFNLLGSTALACAVLLVLFSPRLKRLIGQSSPTAEQREPLAA